MIKSYIRNSRRYLKKNYIIYTIFSYIVSIVIFLYLKLVKLTSKVILDTPSSFTSLKPKPAIFCFWHGRLLSAIYARKLASKATVLLSKGKDGDLVAILMKLFKVDTIRGSTSRNNIDKGGASSFKLMINLLNTKDEVLAIAPDGPIGPRMRVTPGVALLSLLTNTPIIPITISSKKRIVFNSWDKFMLPLPFSKIIIKVNEPIFPIDSSLKKFSLEGYRKEIENIMIKQTQDLDKSLNLPTVMASQLDKKNKPLKRKLK